MIFFDWILSRQSLCRESHLCREPTVDGGHPDREWISLAPCIVLAAPALRVIFRCANKERDNAQLDDHCLSKDQTSFDLKEKMKFSSLAVLAATAGSAAAEIYLKESFDDVSY